MGGQQQDKAQIGIYYDGECPFCSQYVRHVNIRESFGAPALIDVRRDAAGLALCRARGFDLDRGMVVRIDDQYYYGDRAVQALAMISTGQGWFNRMNKMIFSIPFLAMVLYPLMALGRNMTLALLGRRLIGAGDDPAAAEREKADGRSRALFGVFAAVWALYTVFHVSYLVYYGLVTTAPWPALPWIMLALALGVLFNPGSVRLFAALAVVQLAEMWLQMPMISNHAILQFFVSLAIAGAGITVLWQRRGAADFYRLFAPAGRWLLLIMYMFGIFHKINTDFLNVDASCAVALWREYPFPDFIGENRLFHIMAIYATFVIEGFVMLALLFRRTRHAGVVAGCGFHLFLGICTFAYYGPFSLLSFALHMLFLPPEFVQRVRDSRVCAFYQAHRTLCAALFGVLGALLFFAAWQGIVALAAGVFLICALPLWGLVILYGRDDYTQAEPRYPLAAGPWAALVAALFFLNNMMPYAGLKTHQSINMFANLHLEGGRSNHLIFRNPPSLFGYLDDVVMVKAIGLTDGTQEQEAHYAALYFNVLDRLERQRNMWVTFERNGVVVERADYNALKEDIAAILPSRTVRKWMHFSRVALERPRRCDRPVR